MAENTYIDGLLIENSLVVEEHTVIVSTDETLSVVVEATDTPSTAPVVIEDETTTVLAVNEIVSVIVEGTQGPQGKPGVAGTAGGVAETSPIFTYSGPLLTRVDFASGNYKELTYNASGVLTTVRYVKGTSMSTLLRTFVYDAGQLLRIEDTEE